MNSLTRRWMSICSRSMLILSIIHVQFEAMSASSLWHRLQSKQFFVHYLNSTQRFTFKFRTHDLHNMPMVHVIFRYILVGLQKGLTTFKLPFLIIIFSLSLFSQLHRVARVQPDVSSVTLDRLSLDTFGDFTPTVARLSRLANRMTRGLNKTEVLKERNQTIDEIIEEFGLMVAFEHYIYMPGGHWRPRNCAPKWKVNDWEIFSKAD